MGQNSKGWAWAWVLLVLAAAAAVWFWLSSRQVIAPEVSETAGSALIADDTTATIDKEVNAVDLGNPDKELQATDADVNSL